MPSVTARAREAKLLGALEDPGTKTRPYDYSDGKERAIKVERMTPPESDAYPRLDLGIRSLSTPGRPRPLGPCQNA
jgi:hypothetical protein